MERNGRDDDRAGHRGACLSWTGRYLVPWWMRALAATGAAALTIGATELRSEASLVIFVLFPAALLLTGSRKAQVTLVERSLSVRAGWRRRQVDLHGDKVVVSLRRWAHYRTVRGLAVCCHAQPDRPLVIGTRETFSPARKGRAENPFAIGTRDTILPVDPGELETCRHVDVVLPGAAFRELVRALAKSADDRRAVAALRVPGRTAVFDLWPAGRFPCAFLATAVALGGLGVCNRLWSRHWGWSGVNSPLLLYVVIALVALAILADLRTQLRTGYVRFRLTVEAGELVLRRPGKDNVLAHAPLFSLDVARGVWRGDSEESSLRALPSLRIAGPSFLLTAGTMAGPGDPRVQPSADRPCLHWPADVRRGRAPQYVILPEDWPELVRILSIEALRAS